MNHSPGDIARVSYEALRALHLDLDIQPYLRLTASARDAFATAAAHTAASGGAVDGQIVSYTNEAIYDALAAEFGPLMNEEYALVTGVVGALTGALTQPLRREVHATPEAIAADPVLSQIISFGSDAEPSAANPGAQIAAEARRYLGQPYAFNGPEPQPDTDVADVGEPLGEQVSDYCHLCGNPKPAGLDHDCSGTHAAAFSLLRCIERMVRLAWADCAGMLGLGAPGDTTTRNLVISVIKQIRDVVNCGPITDGLPLHPDRLVIAALMSVFEPRTETVRISTGRDYGRVSIVNEGDGTTDLVVRWEPPEASDCADFVNRAAETIAQSPDADVPVPSDPWHAPRVGDDVHYVSHGTPGGEYGKECRAAKVTEVSADTQLVGLFVMNPTGTFHNRDVIHFDRRPTQPDTGSKLCGAINRHGGTWHWPA